MVEIKNGGRGCDIGAHVDKNERLHTFSITESEQQAAVQAGRAFNLNTGKITLTADADHAIMYFKNNEDADFVITLVAIGVNSAGTTSDVSEITIVRNPTGGDIISDATAVAMNQNRNFGKTETLEDSLVYKGKSGGTMTGGNDLGLLFTAEGSRLSAGIDLEIPKGSSIGIKLDPNYSSGTVTVYAAIVGYLKDLDA